MGFLSVVFEFCLLLLWFVFMFSGLYLVAVTRVVLRWLVG